MEIGLGSVFVGYVFEKFEKYFRQFSVTVVFKLN